MNRAKISTNRLHTPPFRTILFIAGITLFLAFFLFSAIHTSKNRPPTVVMVTQTLQSLVSDEDTDGDKKITINDHRIQGTEKGDKHFWLSTTDGSRMEVSGTYYLSNLLQDLKRAEEEGRTTLALDASSIYSPPAERISRMMREFYWEGLTRRIDEEGIMASLSDEKIKSSVGFHDVYVTSKDSLAVSYFTSVSKKHPEWKIKMTVLPGQIDAAYVPNLGEHHGLLTLGLQLSGDGAIRGLPFVVPGGRFNEMYGWDSYFIALGLLEDGKIDLAKAMVDNLVYELEHYGKILNANRTYFLTRSQPPFLSSMARAVYEKLPKNMSSKSWLGNVLTAVIQEYFNVWMDSTHLTPTGLSRYFDNGSGPVPEVEPGHYDAIYTEYARRAHMNMQTFRDGFLSGKVRSPELEQYFIHDRAMRESGHDTSYRLDGRCANLVTVDLNSLLYKIETDVALLIEREFKGEFKTCEGKLQTSVQWNSRANTRLKLLNQYLWNENQRMYFDFDVVKGAQTGYISATTFYPLWTGAASKEQAENLVRKALPLLEESGGVVSTSLASRGPISAERPQRQWDYPYGWAPHQIIVWQGLLRYGYEAIVNRLVYKWLYTMTSNAVDYNGTIAEKYDVVKRSHEVFAEYGNVGTKFAYITREGFGWTNASYQIGLKILPEEYHARLDRLIPPEWVFEK